MKSSFFTRCLLVGALLTISLSAKAESEIEFVQANYQKLFEASDHGPINPSQIGGAFEFFDFDYFFERTTCDISKKLTYEERMRLKSTFKELFFKKALRRGIGMDPSQFHSNRFVLSGKTSRNSTVSMNGIVKKTKIKIDFELVPYRKSDWRVTDITIAGASLVRNYQSQFNRLFRTRGFEGLIERLQKKME